MEKFLSVTEISGSLKTCGIDYGARFSELIRGFLYQECRPNKNWLSYAKQCLRQIAKYAPNSLAFLEGMAKGTGLTLAEVTLLSLHEEIYHLKFAKSSHCSVLGISGSAARSSKSIIGQNWDWPLSYSPWAGLLRLEIAQFPSIATYHYPGLWACAGINSSGLGLMWSAGGYLPVIRPKVGVPTYILTFEIFLRNSVSAALNFLDNTPRAGSFIFTIADKSNLTIVEATPAKMAYVQHLETTVRSSHYCFPRIVKNSRQKTHTKSAKLSLRSLKTLSSAAKALHKADCQAVANLLSKRGVLHNSAFEPFTHDQLIVDCGSATLSTRRVGMSKMGKWQRLRAKSKK